MVDSQPLLDIQTSHVQIQNGALSIDAYLAEPLGDGEFPGILVIQEIFGVNAHIREVTARFAQAGYVAIAPAIYQRIAPGFEAGYTPADIQVGRQYKEQTKADELLGDMAAAIAYLKTHPHVKSTGFGCIGFCFGGLVAYLTATLPDIKATASFYGAGIPTWCPGGGEPAIAYTPKITGTLYGFFGLEDPSIPPEHIDQIEEALKQYHIPHQILRYPGAQHGFFCDHRASYDPEAASNAWKQVLTLFQTTLVSV